MIDSPKTSPTCRPLSLAIALLLICFSKTGAAQIPAANPTAPEKDGHEIYLSWGYNMENYRPVELRIEQPIYGNDFTLHAVDYHDSKGWSTGLLSHSVTGPQYNFHFGYFFRKNTAFEVSFVHAKAIVTQDQTVHMTGIMAGLPVDQNVVLTEDVLTYKLNNGANFALFNAVQRFPLLRKPGQTGSVSVLGKAGIGFVAPHTENSVFGVPNKKGFQFTGPDLGVEIAVRLHLFRAIYTEFAEKGVYARYRDVNINQGQAQQELWAHVTVLSFGASFNIGKKK